VPDTPLVSETIEYAREHSEPYLFNHVMRSWLFAVLLAQQKQSTWTQLSPQLRERCRAAAGPSYRRLGGRPSVAFDEADAELTVPADFARSLAIGRTRWTTLAEGRPADADYGVAWTREPVRSDPVLAAEQLTLRVRDRRGAVVAADTQFRLEWQGGLQPEFVRCAALDGPRRAKPDLSALVDVFGRAGSGGGGG